MIQGEDDIKHNGNNHNNNSIATKFLKKIGENNIIDNDRKVMKRQLKIQE